ncbi:MAG TPA: 4a-hydroxytetrahydrobiopterin dehydratase [Anaerolineales bacterium]|nr:4a-hydroxytetrahydrobiopterin dehydratase [Anaerolineales bacterium]
MNLTEMKCVPCRGDVPPLTNDEIQAHLPEVPEWEVIELKGIPRLDRQYKFKNFAQALAFTNAVGELAEEQDHHPAILTEWGKVTVTWWTHKIKGLHLNDFIMASRSDQAYAAIQ